MSRQGGKGDGWSVVGSGKARKEARILILGACEMFPYMVTGLRSVIKLRISRWEIVLDYLGQPGTVTSPHRREAGGPRRSRRCDRGSKRLE